MVDSGALMAAIFGIILRLLSMMVGSGAIMAAIVGMTASFQPEPQDKYSPLFWHRQQRKP